jgi:hypothetical protein
MGYKNGHNFTFSVLRVLKAGETFIIAFRTSIAIERLRHWDTFYYHETILIPKDRLFQIITFQLRYTKQPISPPWRHSVPVRDKLVSKVSCLGTLYQESVIQ